MNRTPPHAPGDETVTLDISVTPFRPGERRGTILRLGADSFKLSQEQSERLAGDLLDAVRPDLRVEPHGQDPSGLCERAGSGALAPGGALTPDRYDPDRQPHRHRHGQADRTGTVRRVGPAAGSRRRSGHGP